VREIVDSTAFEKPVLFTSAIDLLASTAPFDSFELGRIVRSVQFQMDQNTCLFCIENGRMGGYLGWILTSNEIVEEWRTNSGTLRPDPAAQVIVVTILAVSSPDMIMPLIRKAKTRAGGRPVHWKRLSKEGITEALRSVP